MSSVDVDPGVCLAFGGTNARVATCIRGDIERFRADETPHQPEEFFRWMARSILNASHEGSGWVVAGFPGPVSPDGRIVGPLSNVAGMSEEEYDLRSELVAADPAIESLLDQGFVLLAVNDGTLAAQAAASRIGEHAYDKTGALIVGTGIGAGVVGKDPNYPNVHRTDNSNPHEIGHIIRSIRPFEDFEGRFSGPKLEERFGISPKDMPADHPAWVEEGHAIGILATALGLMSGVKLVVPTGGVGAGAAHKYEPHLNWFMERYFADGNQTQRNLAPEIKLVPPGMADEFEMYGAEGAMRDHLTK